MGVYNKTEVQPLLTVTEIAILQYIRYNKKGFEAEAHDFWELMYLDRGEAAVWVDGKVHTLRAGDILLYAPNAKHRPVGNWDGTCVGFVSFACDSPALWEIADTCMHPDAASRHLLAELFAEGAQYLEPMPKGSHLWGQCLKKEMKDYVLQIVRNQVELLLLRLYEQVDLAPRVPRSANMENFDAEIKNNIISYVRDNLHALPPLEKGAAALGISTSKLKAVCREQFGMGFHAYCMEMRLLEAKRMIRREGMTFTEIAEKLGYPSVHYFSKQFKKITGITPTEYGKSVE